MTPARSLHWSFLMSKLVALSACVLALVALVGAVSCSPASECNGAACIDDVAGEAGANDEADSPDGGSRANDGGLLSDGRAPDGRVPDGVLPDGGSCGAHDVACA